LDLIEAKALTHNRHPWEHARAAFFDRQVLRVFGREMPCRVLDVGCGDGWFGRQLLGRLPAGSELVGWDIALDDERLEIFSADLPDGMSLTRAEPPGDFDLILCMDVIEHVPDDLALLSDLSGRFLRPGGHLLVTVPAWQGLFSKHDLALRHYRRYSPKAGVAVVRAAGLEVVRKGGLFHGLAAVRRLQVARWGRAEPLDDPATYPEAEEAVGLGAWNAPAPVTAVVSMALRAEGWLSAASSATGVELPGLSWWVLCRKP
jgi:SAM-dependent methyltransferase